MGKKRFLEGLNLKKVLQNKNIKMKSNDAGLAKKIDNIIEELDLAELAKEPVSRICDNFIDYLKQNKENVGESPSIEDMLTLHRKHMSTQLKVDKAMCSRFNSWERIAQDRFSELLSEEVGINREDIAIIKKPFCKLGQGIKFLDELQDLMKEFDLNFLIKYRDKKIPIYKFSKIFGNNDCHKLAHLYHTSIDALLNIINMQVTTLTGKEINNKLLDKVIIPMKKGREGYVNEEKIKQQFMDFCEFESKMCGERVYGEKNFLLNNTISIDKLYSEIKESYSNLKEYFEKNMGLDI